MNTNLNLEVGKPAVDWSAMPRWAKWVAMDESGKWYFFFETPSKKTTVWLAASCGFIPPEYYPTFTGNWKDSLIERPQ